MNVFSMSLIFCLSFLHLVTGRNSPTSRTELVLSRIENEVKTLRSDVSLLQYDSAEVLLKIDALNKTCYRGNKCSDPACKQDESRQKTEVTSDQTLRTLPDTDAVSRLFKAFAREKIFYRKKINVLLESQNEVKTKLDSLEAENVALKENLNNERENKETFLMETQHKIAIFDIQINDISNRVQKLESSIVFMNDSFHNQHEKYDSVMTDHKNQLKAVESQNENLETSSRQCKETLETISVEISQKDKLERECDSSWIINRVLNACFLFQSKQRSWNDAAAFCKARGARLVEINDWEKHEQVKRMFEETNLSLDWGGSKYDSFWTGGSRDGSKWKWEGSGTYFTWSHWYPREPSYSQNCVAVMINDPSFRWDDQDCWIINEFMCEKIIE